MLSGSLFPARDQSPRKTWRWFWPVLGLAFLARLAMAAWGDVPVHPDETYQYLEQAHRLVYGYGVIPWEYTLGIRSWLIPGALASVLWLGQLAGLDEPFLYMPLVKGVLCLLSLTLPAGMYRLTQAVASERAAILAFLFGCFWHHFLYYAPKPMPGILATYALVWMVVLMLRPPTRANLLVAGLLSGLIFTLRYQLVPVLGLLNIFVLLRLGRGFGAMLTGNLVALLLAGLLDLATWGGFLSSFIDNFRLNFLYDVSSNFGTTPLDFYAKRFGVESGGLVLLALPGVLMLWPRLWPVIVATAIGVLAFHIPGHKEFRFVVWAMPFVLIAVAVAVCHPRLPRHPATVAVLVWGAAVTGAFSGLYTGLQPYKSEARFGAAIFTALSHTENVTGVVFHTPSLSWEQLPGYYGLGHPAPVFNGALPRLGTDEERAARQAEASHLVTEDPDTAPDGFERIGRYGPYSLWKAVTARPAQGLTGIDLRLDRPVNIPNDFRRFGQARN